jgi:hypothetical protein
VEVNKTSVIPLIDDRSLRSSFKRIKLNLTDGDNFYIIDKPHIFIDDIMEKQLKSLKILFEKYPNLKFKFTFKKYM